MELLKERILKDGIVIMPDILKVDSFLNHQIDPTLYRQIAQEFKARFKDTKITKILTIEASGIGIALATAFEFDDASSCLFTGCRIKRRWKSNCNHYVQLQYRR